MLCAAVVCCREEGGILERFSELRLRLQQDAIFVVTDSSTCVHPDALSFVARLLSHL